MGRAHGALLKSRAKATSVFYNRLTGEGGTSSYEIDIPNGGDFKAIGNLVQQGNMTENYALISYGAEGYRWPTNRAQIVFNTLVNDRAQGSVFITIRPGPAEAFISNNILVGHGKFDVKAPATIKNNAEARVADFVEPSSSTIDFARAANCLALRVLLARSARKPGRQGSIATWPARLTWG